MLGLSPLLERHLGIKLSKKYQRADWARRPLPDDMIEYAASDTRHLSSLVDILSDALDQAGRTEWALEEFSLLEAIRWEDEGPTDPVVRVNDFVSDLERQQGPPSGHACFRKTHRVEGSTRPS